MRLENSQIRPVINLLGDIVKSSELDMEKISDGIESLETMKNMVDADDDDTIDKIDEAQDYLHYLMSVDEPVISEEIKEELAEIIENLQNL